ncbi:hypothetical protein NKG94_18370 [Micromonospora sp. M12]
MIDDLDLGFDEPERVRRADTGAASARARARAGPVAAAAARRSWPC